MLISGVLEQEMQEEINGTPPLSTDSSPNIGPNSFGIEGHRRTGGGGLREELQEGLSGLRQV